MLFVRVCSSFKLFLELEPQLRDVLYKFHESQYAACLKLLDEMRVGHVHGYVLYANLNYIYIIIIIFICYKTQSNTKVAVKIWRGDLKKLSGLYKEFTSKTQNDAE